MLCSEPVSKAPKWPTKYSYFEFWAMWWNVYICILYTFIYPCWNMCIMVNKNKLSVYFSMDEWLYIKMDYIITPRNWSKIIMVGGDVNGFFHFITHWCMFKCSDFSCFFFLFWKHGKTNKDVMIWLNMSNTCISETSRSKLHSTITTA